MDRQAIIDEARAAIEASNQLFADCGVTAEACLEQVRELGGEAAAQRVRDSVALELSGIEDQVRRDVFHSSAPSTPVIDRAARISRRLARRGAI